MSKLSAKEAVAVVNILCVT